jgi:hypothetical protein
VCGNQSLLSVHLSSVRLHYPALLSHPHRAQDIELKTKDAPATYVAALNEKDVVVALSVVEDNAETLKFGKVTSVARSLSASPFPLRSVFRSARCFSLAIAIAVPSVRCALLSPRAAGRAAASGDGLVPLPAPHAASDAAVSAGASVRRADGVGLVAR